MTEDKYLIAATCADLHFYHKAPLARSVETDWLEVQRGYLRQLNKLCNPRIENGRAFQFQTIPCFISGDLSDRAVVAPEVVNMMMGELPPRTYCIAGNHDLPNHRYEALSKCSYGTLVAAGKIRDVKPGEPLVIDGPTPMRLHGFPCGVDIKPLNNPQDMYLEIALVHSYIWTKNTGYPGAPEDKRVKAYAPNLKGYDIALWGDNHIPFEYQTKDGCLVYNAGGFLRRKQDERNHRPSVGLIYSDGSIERHYLDCSQDKFLDAPDADEFYGIMDGIGANGFIESLLELGDAALNFRETVTHLLTKEKVDPRVKNIILKALDKGEQQ